MIKKIRRIFTQLINPFEERRGHHMSNIATKEAEPRKKGLRYYLHLYMDMGSRRKQPEKVLLTKSTLNISTKKRNFMKRVQAPVEPVRFYESEVSYQAKLQSKIQWLLSKGYSYEEAKKKAIESISDYRNKNSTYEKER